MFPAKNPDNSTLRGGERPLRLQLKSLQAFRGFAAVAVVYFHLYVIAPKFLGFEYNGPGAASGNLGVSFFFTLSGFIITWVHLDDLGDRKKIVPYVVKRLMRIYPMVWIVVLVKIAVLLVVPSIDVSDKNNASTIIASLLLLPHPHYVIDVQWTLVYEALFYGIFAGWIYLGRKAAAFSLALWIIALITITPPSPLYNEMLACLLSTCNLLFIGGTLIAYLLKRFHVPLYIAEFLVSFSAIFLVCGILSGVRSHFFWSPVFCALIAGLVSLDRSRPIGWPKWILFMGDASYSIYLVHTSIQMFVVLMGRKLGVPFQPYGQLLFHIVGILSVIGGLACYRWLESPILAWTRGRHKSFD